MRTNHGPVTDWELGGVPAKPLFRPDFEPGSQEPPPLLYTCTRPQPLFSPAFPTILQSQLSETLPTPGI